MLTQHTTSSLNATDRFSYWHDVVCRLFSSCEGLPATNESSFNASVTERVFGAVQIEEVNSSPIQYVRRQQDINCGPCDDFFVSLMLRGTAELVQAGRQAKLTEGDLVIWDSAQPYQQNMPDAYESIVVKVARPILTSRLADAERITAMRLPSSSKLGALAGAMIRESAKIDASLSSQTLQRLSTSLVDIVAAALEQHLIGLPQSNSRHGQLLNKAKKFMLAHLDDPELDIERIASAVNTAPRSINRLFAADGTTAMRWLWQQRLTGSYNALIEGREQRVIDVAMRFGFSDCSHFTRVFKKAFNILPHMIIQR